MILAIDTSAGTSIAVVDGETVLTERSTPDTMRHAEVIGEMIQSCLAEAGVTPSQITHVAAGMGPGPFTGLRVGIAAAYAFSFGSGAELLPMVSHGAIALEVLAENAEVDIHEAVQVVTDARRKEVYVSEYSGLDEGGCPTLTAGPDLAKPDDVAPFSGLRVDATEVSAAWLGRLAHRMLAGGHAFPEADALYLRSPDVTLSNGPKRVVQK